MKSTDPNSKGDAVYVGVDNQTGANVYPDNDPAATVDGFVDLENISIDKLPIAVDFYKQLLRNYA